MNKFFIALIISLSFGALALQNNNRSGFSDPAPDLFTVIQVKTLPDETWVTLEGNILKQIAHELYEFSDSSGVMHIDINDESWAGKTASPGNKVRIEGEVDRYMGRIEVDVKSLHILN